MTSKVTVDAHAGWPVKVTAIDEFGGEVLETELATVKPGEKMDFHITDTRKIVVKELPRG